MDEREKLRRFRELDDAFAAALRELDTAAPTDAASGPADASPAASRVKPEPHDTGATDDPRARQQAFERRLKALMQDYALPEESVSDMIRTLQSLGRLA